MPQQAAEMGDGKVWAILSARAALYMPADEGLQACAEHAERAAEIYGNMSRHNDQPTQAKTCEQFASIVGQTIADWQEGSPLPVKHNDLTADLGSRALKRGDKLFVRHTFNPDADHLSTAAHRLRVVRLAVPEILRSVPPNQTSLEQPIDEIASHLATICLPGQLFRSRPQGYRSYSWY